MPPSPLVSVAESAGVFEVGTRVIHLGVPGVGVGRITNYYPNGRCDAAFGGTTFSGISTRSLCLAEDVEREQQRQEELARVALEQARALEAELARAQAARRDLTRKVRRGRRLTDEDWVLLRSLALKDQLAIVTSAKAVELRMEELVQLLQRASADSSLDEALTAFWKACTPTAECLPLRSLAPSWWDERLWRVVYYTPLRPRDKFQFLLNDSGQLRDELRQELIQELVTNYAGDESFEKALTQTSTRFRLEALLAIGSDILARCQNWAIPLLLDAGGANTNNVSPTLIDKFWLRHAESIPRDSPFFAIAPSNIQRHILRKHFRDHLMRLARLLNHNSGQTGDWPAEVVYGELDADDRKLARLWCSGADSSHNLARMLSARAAEKVAAWFYSHLGLEPIDVAIHQLTGESTAWQTHDLLLNGSKPLDVKNARLPVNSSAFYVEHTVPRFKRDRRGRDVTLVGVVSPYLSLNYMLDLDSASFEVSDVRYLGESYLDVISQLFAKFSSRALTVQDPKDGAFLPPWYFDFPDAWYRDFDFISTKLQRAELPDENETRLLYEADFCEFPIPQYLAARLALPKWLLDGVAPWMRELVSQIQTACTPRPKLAYLFLLLLTDFLSKLQEDPIESYEPNAYLDLLFEKHASVDSPSFRRPLGLEDPLHTIRTLCQSLQTLWTAREHLELGRFSQYRLSGGGILQGRVGPSFPWETVLAYCGGYINGKGRCGCTPLILGVESPCPVCRKLICRSCGYCSDRCAVYRPKPDIDAQ